MAALKVVGSGVDASQVGTGKTITTGRAIAHRATTTRRFRALVVAEGRLLGQWRDELTHGAPGRGLPPLAPNAAVRVLCEHRSIAAQVRALDRELGDRPGVMLCPNGVLDRYPADLQAIAWHLLVADEALRYANPATEAHQALRQVRFACVADCWLLTATPRGKSAEHLDVLVGLALGDEAMIRERLNTREAGDLLDEVNAHRLRVNYGPHLVRVTRQDMQAWMPAVRPAKPLALEPDPALAELLDAIRHGGRDAYRRLLEILRELKTLEPGDSLYKQALAELARAQGVVLGNVGVYVDASVDPETLTHSKAALAQALVRQGLVAEATRGGGDGLPLLRGVTAADDRRRRRRRAGDRVRRPRPLPAPARAHPARAPRRRSPRRRRGAHGPRVRRDQAAVLRRRVPRPVPVADRARGPQPPERLRTRAPRPAVAADRARAARRPRRPARRRPRLRCRPTSPTSRTPGSRTSSPCSRRAAASTTRSSTRSRASRPPTRPSPASSARSPARSPTTRTRPATPAPPRGCAWQPPSSAPRSEARSAGSVARSATPRAPCCPDPVMTGPPAVGRRRRVGRSRQPARGRSNRRVDAGTRCQSRMGSFLLTLHACRSRSNSAVMRRGFTWESQDQRPDARCRRPR